VPTVAPKAERPKFEPKIEPKTEPTPALKPGPTTGPTTGPDRPAFEPFVPKSGAAERPKFAPTTQPPARTFAKPSDMPPPSAPPTPRVEEQTDTADEDSVDAREMRALSRQERKLERAALRREKQEARNAARQAKAEAKAQDRLAERDDESRDDEPSDTAVIPAISSTDADTGSGTDTGTDTGSDSDAEAGPEAMVGPSSARDARARAAQRRVVRDTPGRPVVRQAEAATQKLPSVGGAPEATPDSKEAEAAQPERKVEVRRPEPSPGRPVFERNQDQPLARADRAIEARRPERSEAAEAESGADGSALAGVAGVVGILGLVLSVVLAVGALLVAVGAEFGALSSVCDVLVGPLKNAFEFNGQGAQRKENFLAWGAGSVVYLLLSFVGQAVQRANAAD